jgi:uncharacterized membrane protein YwzB
MQYVWRGRVVVVVVVFVVVVVVVVVVVENFTLTYLQKSIQ